MKRLGLLPLLLLAACGGAPPLDWQLNSVAATNAFQQDYLRGDTEAADLEFARLKSEISSTGRGDLAARAELVRCAARTASLDFDDCPGFEALRPDAGQEELAYADYLAGKADRPASDDALSKLVLLGVRMKNSKATPQDISAAIDIASAQGWRRPLLAWLGVQEKRAEAAGDSAALEKIRRRIALASGKS
jgi:hypothetical protein